MKRKPRPTKAEKIAAAKAFAEATFLEYHSDTAGGKAYATAKIARGLAPNTPESLQVMLSVIAQRKLDAERLAALNDEIEAEKKAPTDAR